MTKQIPTEKNWLKKSIAELTAVFFRIQLIINSKVFQILPPIRRVLKLVLCLVFLGVLFYMRNKYYGQIESYLIKLNIDSQGNPTSFFPSLFITLGAACLTVLAITFSLSLFAIQQAADKHTPAILINFSRDRVNKYFFWAIAIISLAFFLFAFLPVNHLLFYEVLSGLFFLIIIFCLFRKQYAHIINLVNPLYQIDCHRKNGIKLLNGIDKHLDILIKSKAIRPGPKSDIEKLSKKEKRDLLRSGAIFRSPNLFDGLKNYLNQIYALLLTYQKRKDYQVTQRGFYSIYSLLYKYINVKNGAFFPSSMIQALDYSHDDFLIEVFEKLTAIHKGCD